MRVKTCSLLLLIKIDVFEVLFISFSAVTGNTSGCLRPNTALSLGIICSVQFFQFMWLSICEPRNFVCPVSSIYFYL